MWVPAKRKSKEEGEVEATEEQFAAPSEEVPPYLTGKREVAEATGEGAGRTQAESSLGAGSSAESPALLLGHTQVNEQEMQKSMQEWNLETYKGKHYCVRGHAEVNKRYAVEDIQAYVIHRCTNESRAWKAQEAPRWLTISDYVATLRSAGSAAESAFVWPST